MQCSETTILHAHRPWSLVLLFSLISTFSIILLERKNLYFPLPNLRFHSPLVVPKSEQGDPFMWDTVWTGKVAGQIYMNEIHGGFKPQ